MSSRSDRLWQKPRLTAFLDTARQIRITMKLFVSGSVGILDGISGRNGW